MIRIFAGMLGAACALLAGCNRASEEQLVENTVNGVLTSQGGGTVQQLDLTRGADNNYSGPAALRRPDGTTIRYNCTARRAATAGNFDILCGQVLDEALIAELETAMRASLTGQNLTVTQMELSRRDDDHFTGFAEGSDAGGGTVRLACAGSRQANGRFDGRCEQNDATPAAPAPAEAPASEEAPADGQ